MRYKYYVYMYTQIECVCIGVCEQPDSVKWIEKTMRLTSVQYVLSPLVALIGVLDRNSRKLVKATIYWLTGNLAKTIAISE